MVANVANCGRFVWCQNDPFCLNTGHCPKTREIWPERPFGQLRNSNRTVDQSRQIPTLCAMATNGEPRGNCSVEPFLAEISYGVEDRRPGPTPQVGCPNLAKDRVNTMSTSPKIPSLQAYQLALYRGPLPPRIFPGGNPKDPAPQRIRSRSLAVPRRPHRSLRIRSKLCHGSPLRRG